MSTHFAIHIEPTPEGGVVWWAETPAIAGLSVAADSLQELYPLALEAVEQHLGAEARLDVRFDLVTAPAETGGLNVMSAVGRPLVTDAPASHFEARRAILAPS